MKQLNSTITVTRECLAAMDRLPHCVSASGLTIHILGVTQFNHLVFKATPLHPSKGYNGVNRSSVGKGLTIQERSDRIEAACIATTEWFRMLPRPVRDGNW